MQQLAETRVVGVGWCWNHINSVCVDHQLCCIVQQRLLIRL